MENMRRDTAKCRRTCCNDLQEKFYELFLKLVPTGIGPTQNLLSALETLKPAFCSEESEFFRIVSIEVLVILEIFAYVNIQSKRPLPH